MRIARVDARTVRIPLEQPIRTADLRIDAREFVLVDVHLDDGTVGRGFGLTRDGLVAATITKNLAPLLIGRDARFGERIWADLYEATRYLGRKGLLMRAISALDVALWDAKAKHLGLPVWVLLGGYADRIHVHVAGGYYRPDEDLEREFAGYREAGYVGAKLNVGGRTLQEDVARATAARRGWGDDAPLTADFNGAMRDARTALRWAHALADVGVTAIEEPFRMDDAPSWRGFRHRSPVPVAMGEDDAGRWSFANWIADDAVDVLRHDATLVGGISEWMKVAGLALAHRIPIFPHWFPDVHVHLAAAVPDCVGIEVVDHASGIMDVHRIIDDPVGPAPGGLAPPETPGLGIRWNREAVEQWTV